MKPFRARIAVALVALIGTAAPAAAADVSALGYGALLPGGNQAGASLSGAGERSAAASGVRPTGGGTIATLTTELTASDDGVSGSAAGVIAAEGITLLDGRVTIDSLRLAARVTVDGAGRSVTIDEATVGGLVVNGEAVNAGVGSRVAVPGIGALVFFERSDSDDGAGINGLRVEVTDPEAAAIIGGPFVIAHLDLSATAGRPAATAPATTAPATTAPATTTPRRGGPIPPPRRSPRAGERPTPTAAPGRTVPTRPVRPPAVIAPEPNPLSPLPRQAVPAIPAIPGEGYAFPVQGAVGYSDDFLAPRAGTGQHYGNDLFADTGTPVVAVADGRLSKVGVNTLGGNRLWLTDERGNWFYYAHMSAYAPATVEGAQVRRGQVIGFVGNTGQAITTPPHLHFEIHPGGMDAAAINPYPLLLAWERGSEETPRAFVAGGTEASTLGGAAPSVGAVVVDSMPERDQGVPSEDGLAVPVV